MRTRNSKLTLVALATAALIVGCGGSPGSGPSGGGGGTTADSGDISTSPTALIAFMQNLMATDENGDAIDINALALVQDDAGDPVFPII